MNRISARRIGIGALAILAIIVIAYLVTVLFGGIGGDRTATIGQPVDPALVRRGAYVATLSDCAACHTAPGGQSLAGGLPIATPIGKVFTTNITPDRATGIGAYSYGDFERAVRRGIRPDGSSLYPAMPFPAYAHLTDADTKALYAWFMHGVKPVAQSDKAPAIHWPLSMRWPLTYWRWLFAPGVRQLGMPGSADPQLARGAYLVEGPGHCGSCHTPRGIALESKAYVQQDGPAFLSGGVVDGYVASNLRGDPRTGLGSWSEQDIVNFLKTGHNRHSAVFGGMSDVVVHSTQRMTDADLKAIARFLKSLPGNRDETPFAPDRKETAALGNLDVSKPGALDYMNSCAACHLSSGKGYDETFPALAGNSAVVAHDPASLIHIILTGSTRPSTAKAPTDFAMPGFSDRLTDSEVAAIATFVRSSWGNRASGVSASDVTKTRRHLSLSSTLRK